MKEYKRFCIVITIIIVFIWIGIIVIYCQSNRQLDRIREQKEENICVEIERIVSEGKTSVPNEEVITRKTDNMIITQNEVIIKNEYYEIVQAYGDVNEEYVETVEEILLTLPPKLVESFISNGFSIYVTTENIAQVYYEGKFKSVRATFRRKKKEIRVENREEAIFGSVEHEFGHYLDMINGDISWSEEFGKIYEEEAAEFKTRISNPGCVSDQGEFFAEIFAYIIKDPSKCTPKAKEFVQRYIDKLNIPVEESDQYGCSFFLI